MFDSYALEKAYCESQKLVAAGCFAEGRITPDEGK